MQTYIHINKKAYILKYANSLCKHVQAEKVSGYIIHVYMIIMKKYTRVENKL